MNKLKSLPKLSQKKRKSTKIPSKPITEPLSSTPSLKILTQHSTVRSSAPTRDTQSHASSPHTARNSLRSFQPSPSLKSFQKIDQLLQDSLKRFTSEKLELAKIKEFAKQWKNKRKKKTQECENTKIETKPKSSSKNSRPKTAWASPDFNDRLAQTPQVLSKHTAGNSVERRANIGLEFYNLKSPRNITPKNLQEDRKVQKEKKLKNKQKITEFIKKKKKERRKQVKKVKELEEEGEIKRFAQLVKLERTAKQLVKTQKKVQKVKIVEKKQPLKSRIKRESIDSETPMTLIKKSICYSEDEEVVNIMQVRNLSSVELEVNEGRQCLIFGDSLEQVCADKEHSELVFEIMEKRGKSEDISRVVSASMPIIELRSISNDSSSEFSDKKILFQRTEKARQKVNASEQVKKKKSPKKLCLAIRKIVKNVLLLPFSMIKCYKLVNLTVFEISQCLKSKKNSAELKSTAKKLEFEEMLNQLIKSCENSEDLEGDWEKFEKNLKNINTSNEKQALSNENSLKLNIPAEKTSSSVLLIKELKSLQSPSLEIPSFTSHSEKLFETDFPSLVSESRVSEEVFEKPTRFVDRNSAGNIIQAEEEPSQCLNPILVFDEQFLVFDQVSAKENPLVITSESEDIEEFSLNNRKNFVSPQRTELYIRPFTASEPSFMDEDLYIEATIHSLINYVYFHYVGVAAADDYKKSKNQLLGNLHILMSGDNFYTSEEAIKVYLMKTWQRMDLKTLKKYFLGPAMHLCILGNYDEKLCLKLISNAFPHIEDCEEEVKIHNRMVDDIIKSLLLEIHAEINPPLWRVGCVKSRIDFDEIFGRVFKNVEKLCRVASGKIPTEEMVGKDGVLDEDALQSAREVGLENILAYDILDEEPRWADYRKEEQQSFLDLADFIFSDLIQETELLVNE